MIHDVLWALAIMHIQYDEERASQNKNMLACSELLFVHLGVGGVQRSESGPIQERVSLW